MKELKPCPFCGGECGITVARNHITIMCLKCRANKKTYYLFKDFLENEDEYNEMQREQSFDLTKEPFKSAADKWNTRFIDFTESLIKLFDSM